LVSITIGFATNSVSVTNHHLLKADVWVALLAYNASPTLMIFSVLESSFPTLLSNRPASPLLTCMIKNVRTPDASRGFSKFVLIQHAIFLTGTCKTQPGETNVYH